EVLHVERVPPLIDALSSGRLSVAIFLTGTGAATLLREAGNLERLDEAIDGLRHVVIACRGPKPAAVLSSHGLIPAIAARAPYTTRELIAALDAIDLSGKSVAVLQYGEQNPALAGALTARGASVMDLSLYERRLPATPAPLEGLVLQLAAREIEAIVFTNRAQ